MRHLSTNDIINYAEGRTSFQSNPSIDEHIRICRRCAGEAKGWIELLGSLTASDLTSAPKSAVRNCIAIYQIPQRSSILREVFARLVFDSVAQPEMAGIRGPGDIQHILLQTEDIEIYLRVSRTPRSILGQLMRCDGDFVPGARMELIRDGQRIDMTVTDTLGEFRFNTVPEGDLRLQADIAADDRLIADFAICERGHN